jgi:glycine cleavage system aminomethyltransferase T
VPAVVSRTGWSRDLAFEVFPLDGERAVAIWDGLVDAGSQHGLLVTGPNLSRAIEFGITDNHYFVNSQMDPFEAGAARLVDLDQDDFVGRSALVEISRRPQRRRTVGLLGPPQAECPALRDFWPLRDGGDNSAGVVRWAAYSYALDRPVAIALLDCDRGRAGRLEMETPTGAMPVELAELPFVGRTASNAG